MIFIQYPIDELLLRISQIPVRSPQRQYSIQRTQPSPSIAVHYFKCLAEGIRKIARENAEFG